MKKINKYINYIETVLTNKNIDNEDSEWKQSSELFLLSNPPDNVYIIDSQTMGIDTDELLLLVKVNLEIVNDILVERIKKKIEEQIQSIVTSNNEEPKKDVFKSINLLFFVSSIQSRLTLKEKFSSKNSKDLVEASSIKPPHHLPSLYN